MPKKSPRVVEYKGKRYTIPELAKETGMHPNTLNARIVQHNWPVERAVETPVNTVMKTDQGPKRIAAQEPPSRQLKNYLLNRIKGAIEAMPENEFQDLMHEALRNDFLGTLRELGPWLPKEGEIANRVLSGAGASPVINIDKAYMPQNVIDYEPM